MRIPHSPPESGISFNSAMTPMIDVVFQLLIFFVCAAIGQRIEFDAPADLSGGSTNAAQIQQRKELLDPVWVLLRLSDGQTKTLVQLNREGPVFEDVAEFQANLNALAELGREEIPVILDIAPEVPAGDMLTIYDICRQARFQEILFATQAPPPEGK